MALIDQISFIKELAANHIAEKSDENKFIEESSSLLVSENDASLKLVEQL